MFVCAISGAWVGTIACEGRHITWLEWDMDIGFNYREGLTLHRITYRDPTTARQRPICYRASVAEMAVPYAAPGLDKHRQNPIGAVVSSLLFMYPVRLA